MIDVLRGVALTGSIKSRGWSLMLRPSAWSAPQPSLCFSLLCPPALFVRPYSFLSFTLAFLEASCLPSLAFAAIATTMFYDHTPHGPITTQAYIRLLLQRVMDASFVPSYTRTFRAVLRSCMIMRLKMLIYSVGFTKKHSLRTTA